MLDVGCWASFLAVVSTLTAQGQTNALPLLSPPYGEIPPTFWEQHGTSAILAGLGIVALAGFIAWLVLRPRPKVIIPPEVEAREALEKLRQRVEDGVVLSRVSQIVRKYFITSFQLSSGEFTTAEFNRLISGRSEINAELSAAASDFLRACDARKFSATGGSESMNAAARALSLIEQAEQWRAQSAQRPAETPTPGRHA